MNIDDKIRLLETIVENTIDEFITADNFLLYMLNEKSFESCVDKIFKAAISNKNFSFAFPKGVDNPSITHHILNKNIHIADLKKTDFNNLIENLLKNQSNEAKVDQLARLNSVHSAELVNHDKWPLIAKALQEALNSTDEELSYLSLEIHRKLFQCSSSHYESSLNLLKCLKSKFECQKWVYSTKCGIDLSANIHGSTFLIISVCLNELKNAPKNWLRAKEALIEDYIQHLFGLFNTFIINPSNLSFFHYLSLYDENAIWFKILLNSVQTRKIISKLLKSDQRFFQMCFDQFMIGMNMYKTATIKYESRENIISEDEIAFSVFSHSFSIVSLLMKYTLRNDLFPLRSQALQTTIDIKDFLVWIITHLNCLDENCRYFEVLTKMAKSLFSRDYCLAEDDVTIDLLLKPLVTSRMLLSKTLKVHSYIFYILKKLLKHFTITSTIFGFKRRSRSNTSRKSKTRRTGSPILSADLIKYFDISIFNYDESINEVLPAQIIFEFASNVMLSFVNNYENFNSLDNSFTDMIDVCEDILRMHSHSVYFIRIEKLSNAVLSLHKIMNTYYSQSYYLEKITNLIESIASTRLGLKTLQKDRYFKNNLNNILKRSSIYDVGIPHLICMVANSQLSSSVVMENGKYLISTALHKLWSASEKESAFILGRTYEIDTLLFNFFKALYVLSYSTNALKLLMSEDDDDERTIIELGDFPQNLNELIQSSLLARNDLTTLISLLSLKLLLYSNLSFLSFLSVQFDLKEKLAEAQNAYSISLDEKNKSIIIIDECSILRYHIINYLQDLETHEKQFTDGKLMGRKHPNSALHRTKVRAVNELQKFLQDFKNGLHDNNWLIQLRRIHKSVLTDTFKQCVLLDLIDQVQKMVTFKMVYSFSSTSKHKTSSETSAAISLAVRYGVTNGLLQPNMFNEEHLASFLLTIRPKETVFIDWFGIVVFLSANGNVEKSKLLLKHLMQFPVINILWVNNSILKSNAIEELLQYIDIVINDNVTLSNSFTILGVPFSTIYRQWLNQCFLNILEWNELCHFLAICVLYPTEYVIFSAVCLALHWNTVNLRLNATEDIQNIFEMAKLEGFSWNDWMPQIELMAKRYKHIKLRI